MFFTEYETFKMRDDESLQYMITRLTTIINELASLEKILTAEVHVDNVLRVLPKAKQDMKIIAIKEEKGISTMALDEFVGNHRAYEMNMNDQKREETISKKSLALKASNDER